MSDHDYSKLDLRQASLMPDGSVHDPLNGNTSARRKGDWIQTYTGGMFWPLDPRQAEIDIHDIASGLSNDCRYGGQCLQFYSVAEHSVLMARHARLVGLSQRHQRAALLHDASEGLGLRDIPRPIKADLTNYRAIEHLVMVQIAAKFDFDWPISSVIKKLDEAIGLAEEIQNMAPKPAAWRTQQNRFEAHEPLDVILKCWSPAQAFDEFMAEFVRCGGRVP